MHGATFDAFPAAPVDWGRSEIVALGSALFVPSVVSGGLFLAGLAISNWRHAIVAVLGAFTANALAAQAGSVGGAINLGFIGFNGVLAALAAYVIVAADLRLVILGSVLATWLGIGAGDLAGQLRGPRRTGARAGLGLRRGHLAHPFDRLV